MRLVEFHRAESGELIAINPEYVSAVGIKKGEKVFQTFDHAWINMSNSDTDIEVQEDYKTTLSLLGAAIVRVIGAETIARV